MGKKNVLRARPDLIKSHLDWAALAALPPELQEKVAGHQQGDIDLIQEVWLKLLEAKAAGNETGQEPNMEKVYGSARASARRYMQDVSYYSISLYEDLGIEVIDDLSTTKADMGFLSDELHSDGENRSEWTRQNWVEYLMDKLRIQQRQAYVLIQEAIADPDGAGRELAALLRRCEAQLDMFA